MSLVPSGTRAAAVWTRSLVSWIGWIAAFAAPPLLRVGLAIPFVRSGLTKWNGFLSLSPVAQYLFEEMFKLHLFGGVYSFPAPDVVAWIDGAAEIVLPALLILGLATRFSAFGLLIMTGVIQLTVPDGWATFHLPWAALSVAIMALGPGPLSLDWLIDRAISKSRGEERAL
ncbi:MAG: DoxX family protein [Steroidobacteraceae bacterium]